MSSSSTVSNNATTTGASADPPLPPNWNDNLENTLLSLSPYNLFPIAADTMEYATIAALLHPLKVGVAEQIVNPSLWSRFVNTRKDMLLAKTDDPLLISKLSSNEKKMMQLMHISLSFDKDARVAASPYSDNMALLFHCTRSKTNVDKILLQGLDERLGCGGLLGKGIYFAADPQKSISYDGCGGTIFIVMVLLGDCLSVNGDNKQNVREPEKQKIQQRNLNDIQFDSIVGKPSAAIEYVVYNRYQCCPLYKVSYLRQSPGTVTGTEIYSESKNCLPPFNWASLTPGAAPMPTPSANSDWPFYAKSVFLQMGVLENQEVDVNMPLEVEISESTESIKNKLSVLISLGFTNTEMNFETLKQNSFNLDRAINYLLELGETIIDESEILINNKLATLTSLGFTNTELNARILKRNSYDLNKSVCDLLERLEQGAGDHDLAGPSKVLVSKPEDCPICRDEYDTLAANWKVLQCGHKLCHQCYKQIETTRTTMSGLTQTFYKCPFCMKSSGVEIGTCPDGTMTTSILSTPCQGYEQFGSIRIQYHIESPANRLNRTAYLPNNDEGNELLKLLRIAWDRRICFTIGTSATFGQENVLVWNIHHKTAQKGGVEHHGFPDDTFMKRCKLELNSYGIM